ncbi:MAG: ParB N-terminal domain-containing protein [Symplocastrum torsivum CPER-KK1]|uniref:ParB N-terminal domain-containing protein n=1 Tax=Symplocastrum torsivum CPER-KK1 TaxID=450513 RepID=A0A951PPJ7_9CYAN|nr:ParB N-terminal domain-containing protein [Symplocastrum torsivum CPER-KK1]
MAKRNRLDVDRFFSEVDQTQEVYSLREQLKRLEEQLSQQVSHEQHLITEIEQLRLQSQEQARPQLQNQIRELREHLKQSQSINQYPIDKIQPNPDQPRKTFTEEVDSMALSLQQEGQLDPVILFEDGMLFDGECRWRAAKSLGWDTIEAVFTAKPDHSKVLRRKAYLTSLHRRGLNALDKAETLVAIACDEIPELPPEEVPRIINRVLTRLKRKKQSLGERLHLQHHEQQHVVLEQLEVDPIESQVFLIFLGLQEHPASLNRNIFPALNLTSDLKAAVREQSLGCAQALILNRLSASELKISERQALKLREKGIREVLRQNLSTTQTQQWVIQQKSQYIQHSTSAIRDKQVDRFLSSIQKLDLTSVEASSEQLQELQQTLEDKLVVLQKLLNNKLKSDDGSDFRSQ